MHPAPAGAAGELYIGGPCVGRGYLNRSGLTADVSFPTPSSPVSLYRTGDLVRQRATGELEFCVGTDDQVKLRGFRIELGEWKRLCVRLKGVPKPWC